MAVLLVFTSYVALDTFVITRVYGDASDTGSGSQVTEQTENGQDGSSLSEDADSGQSGSEQSGSDQINNGDSSGNSQSGGKHGPHGGGKGMHKPGSRPGSGSSSGSSDSSGNSANSSSGSSSGNATAAGTVTDSYSDNNINVTLKEYRQNDTTIYVADVKVSSPEYLKTALAQGSYGKNVTAKTSEIASGVNAVLAINGDFYGTQEKGYVIRNGKLYRSTASNGSEDLVIYSDGSFDIVNESEVTAQQLQSKGAEQVLSFGPALIENGSVAVTSEDEVGKAMASNPRTAIGVIDECHYVFVVSDGRTDTSAGLSLLQLAEFMDTLGVETAYNLDGGGSSTMYFKGNVVNNPTTGGSRTKERSVSDIVYIG